MGEYVAKEFKKVKISLFSFELLWVLVVRNTFFRVLNGTSSSSTTQEALEKRVTFEEPRKKPVVFDNAWKRTDVPSSQSTSKQPKRELDQNNRKSSKD